jgi:hypothetical protein
MKPLVAIAILFGLSLSAQAQDLRSYTEPNFGTSALVPVHWRQDGECAPVCGKIAFSTVRHYSPARVAWRI